MFFFFFFFFFFQWFTTHPSLATGLIVAGFGGGALIFNQVITNYINPDNLPPDLTTDDGDKYVYQLIKDKMKQLQNK